MGWSCDFSVGLVLDKLEQLGAFSFPGFQWNGTTIVFELLRREYRDGRAKIRVWDSNSRRLIDEFSLIPVKSNGIVKATKNGHKYLRALGLDPECL